MATFNGVSYTFASFAPFNYATIWDQFWGDVLVEMDNRAGGMGGALPAFITAWDVATADASPGAGKLRANAALAAATQLFISTTDALGGDVSAVIGLFDDSTSTPKGLLRIGHRSNQTKWALFSVTGAVTAAAGYSKVPVSYIAGPGGFSAGDPLALGFVPKGDVGLTGGATLPAGTLAAPGLAVTGDANTGLAQLGGADSLSMVGGGAEVIRATPNAVKVYGAVTIGDRGDGFGSALTLTPGAGPDWHIYSRVSDGALVIFHYKNKAGATVSIERMVLRESGIVDFNQTPTVNGTPIGGGLFSGSTTKSANYTVVASDARYLIECSAALTLSLTAAATLGQGFTFAVWNSGTGSVVVDPAGSETINSAAAITLAAGDWAVITCTGSAWKALRYVSAASTGAAWSTTDKDASITLSETNHLATASGISNYGSLRAASPIVVKTYFEFDIVAVTSPATAPVVGIATAATAITDIEFTAGAGGYGYQKDGQKKNNASAAAFGASYTSGDVIGVAFDPTTGKLHFSKNGAWQSSGDPATGANPAYTVSTAPLYYPAAYLDGNSASTSIRLRPTLAYSIPTGYATF